MTERTNKPSSSEEEYFAREEAEKLKRLSLERNKNIEHAEKKRLKELHWMRCPKCGMELSGVIFRGVTIDKCFGCQGVFLDDGELEKLSGKENKFFDSVFSIFK